MVTPKGQATNMKLIEGQDPNATPSNPDRPAQATPAQATVTPATPPISQPPQQNINQTFTDFQKKIQPLKM